MGGRLQENEYVRRSQVSCGMGTSRVYTDVPRICIHARV